MWNRHLATVDLSDLTAERDTLLFTYTDPFGKQARGFVIVWQGTLRAYRNLCPHWSAPLDRDGEVFSPEGDELFCPLHGATFDPASGQCTFGPPRGTSLETFDIAPAEDQPGHYYILRRAGISLL